MVGQWVVKDAGMSLTEFAEALVQQPSRAGIMRLVQEIAGALTDAENAAGNLAMSFGVALPVEGTTLNCHLVASSWLVKAGALNGIGDVTGLGSDLADGVDRLRALLLKFRDAGAEVPGDLPEGNPKLSVLGDYAGVAFHCDTARRLDSLRGSLGSIRHAPVEESTKRKGSGRPRVAA